MARLNLLEETRYEKLPVTVYKNQQEASLAVAGRIAALIRKKSEKGEKAVLGLATGATPIGVYAELVRQHREEGLSFANVITFNLDEYFPMQPTAVQSYVTFMNENLFNHVDIEKNAGHVDTEEFAGHVDIEEFPGHRGRLATHCWNNILRHYLHYMIVRPPRVHI